MDGIESMDSMAAATSGFVAPIYRSPFEDFAPLSLNSLFASKRLFLLAPPANVGSAL
jgi:hypothetical protein